MASSTEDATPRRSPEPIVDEYPVDPRDQDETYGGKTLEARHEQARDGFDAATAAAIVNFLDPFAESFRALHDVSIVDLPTVQVAPEIEDMAPGVLEEATVLVGAIVEDGTARELATELLHGALSLSTNKHAVRGIVKALPMRAPSSFPGRAAKTIAHTRNAFPKYATRGRFLLKQTQRTFSRNRKTLMVTGALGVAAALIGWGIAAERSVRDKKLSALRQQQLDDIASHQAQLHSDRNEAELLLATERTEEAVEVLTCLTRAGATRLPALQTLAADNAQYDTYGPAERHLLAEVAALAEVVAGVIAGARRTAVAHDDHESVAQTDTLRAAQALLDRCTQDRKSAGTGAVIVASTAATLNITTHRNQLAHILSQRNYLAGLAKRCANVHEGVRAGFFFELLHTLSFNLNAVANDSDLRADMTERLDRPHDPVDIEIRNGDQAVVGRAQAKVVASKYQRVGVKNGIADPKYADEIRLIPTDQLAETRNFIGSVLERPGENIYTSDYQNAYEYLADFISVDEITSDPLTTGEIYQAAADPDSLVHRLISESRRDQALTAGITGGTAAAIGTFATAVSTHVLNEGGLNGVAWAEAGIAAARTGVASSFATAAGNYLRTGAQIAVEDDTAGLFQQSLAHGDHEPALTQAVVKIAAIAHGLATDQLTPVEAAVAVGETITQSAVVWAFMVVARRTIPDAEVAAIVGGLAGQLGAQLVSQGIQLAIIGRDPNPGWDEAYECLLSDIVALERRCTAERDELAELTRLVRGRFESDVQPALERLGAETDPDQALADLVAVADHFGHAPLIADIETFDAFMADPTTTLVLDLCGR